MTDDEIQALRGKMVLRNTTGAPLDLTTYSYTFSPGEELDILNKDTDPAIMAFDFNTARNMVGRAGVGVPPKSTALELAQLISAGTLEVIEVTPPDPAMLQKLA